jgi:hypothetical protein
VSIVDLQPPTRRDLTAMESDWTIDSATIGWPEPFARIMDEHAALAFGRAMNRAVASSVLGELHREICPTHPLFGVKCRPLAFDARIKKAFLFETDRPKLPLAVVHFTWTVESDPRWPWTTSFANIEEFFAWVRQRE